MPIIKTSLSIVRDGSLLMIIFNSETEIVVFKSQNIVIRTEANGTVSISDADKVFSFDYTLSTAPIASSPFELVEAISVIINDPQDRLDLARGIISDKDVVRNFGSNSSLGIDLETIWEGTGMYTFITTAIKLRVKSGGNVADDIAGTGARTLTIEGLDASYLEITETLDLAGASASVDTTNLFLRVNRASIASTGTAQGSNIGIIVLETTSGTELARILSDVGQTNLGVFTIPDNKRGFITRISVNSDTLRGGNVRLNIACPPQTGSAPFGPKRTIWKRSGFNGNIETLITTYIELEARTDMEFVGSMTNGSGRLELEFDILIVNNGT